MEIGITREESLGGPVGDQYFSLHRGDDERIGHAFDRVRHEPLQIAQRGYRTAQRGGIAACMVEWLRGRRHRIAEIEREGRKLAGDRPVDRVEASPAPERIDEEDAEQGRRWRDPQAGGCDQ